MAYFGNLILLCCNKRKENDNGGDCDGGGARHGSASQVMEAENEKTCVQPHNMPSILPYFTWNDNDMHVIIVVVIITKKEIRK